MNALESDLPFSRHQLHATKLLESIRLQGKCEARETGGPNQKCNISGIYAAVCMSEFICGL